ncbi:MAG: glutathione peroxidase [Citrobacter freundii]|nr:MAG: glutathione peroxidase [Citrobacter freundii]
MTYRQKVLNAFYPVLMFFSKATGKNGKSMSNTNGITPPASIYDLSITLNNGTQVPLSTYKGKKILLVNTASDCGYTPQYEDLQKLYSTYQDKLVIIGFPANDFKEQEKGSDEQIAAFCKLNFGVTFPLAKKSTVVRGAEQNPVFNWLSDPAKNGWNDQQPTWNFSKYLVDEKGILIKYFDPGVSPSNPDVKQAIEME